VAKDVAEALGLVWHSGTLRNIKKKWTGEHKLCTPVRQRDGSTVVMENKVTVINEAAVYKLATRSNKPAAEAFTDWVYEEVLPSIRKTGEYVSKRRMKYKEQGKQIAWVEQREVGIKSRKDFTGRLKEHGVSSAGCRFDASAPFKIIGLWLRMSPKHWEFFGKENGRLRGFLTNGHGLVIYQPISGNVVARIELRKPKRFLSRLMRSTS
jgi:prophage antirepressor-like protein